MNLIHNTHLIKHSTHQNNWDEISNLKKGGDKIGTRMRLVDSVVVKEVLEICELGKGSLELGGREVGCEKEVQ